MKFAKCIAWRSQETTNQLSPLKTNDHLQKVPILNQSGFKTNWGGLIPSLRKGYFYVVDIPISGDAPKDFIKVYEYGSARKTNRRKWTAYIAKVGHKWYPIESITEYLLNRIGETLGLKMAASRLMIGNEQIRFLSKYFLGKDERLVHGAQIYSAMLGDEDFVENIEAQGMSRDFFTFQFTEEAIKNSFPEHKDQILCELVKLLIFDAVVGNNDRHFYNWGVITHLKGDEPPRFSPVYDTARGLFWNQSEKWIADFVSQPKQLEQRIAKYADNSRPKIGWENVLNINHFQLVELLHQDDKRYCYLCKDFLQHNSLNKIFEVLDSEFYQLLSLQRMSLIKRCLIYRFERLNAILQPSNPSPP